jgi:hypothetical protein
MSFRPTDMNSSPDSHERSRPQNHRLRWSQTGLAVLSSLILAGNTAPRIPAAAAEGPNPAPQNDRPAVSGNQTDDFSTAGREWTEATAFGGTLLKGASIDTPPDGTLLSGDSISGDVLDTAGIFRLGTAGMMTPDAGARVTAARNLPETSTESWNWVEGLRSANR